MIGLINKECPVGQRMFQCHKIKTQHAMYADELCLQLVISYAGNRKPNGITQY